MDGRMNDGRRTTEALLTKSITAKTGLCLIFRVHFKSIFILDS